MRRTIDWTKEALENLGRIVGTIAKDSPDNAQKFGDELVDATMILSDFPFVGRMFSEHYNPFLREIIKYPYRIVYRITGEEVKILSIEHGKRLRTRRS